MKVEDVGRELGVRYVLEGSVRKAGDRVRVTAQLIDATTGGHVWSERYDRDLSDIFAIQSEISEEILGVVRGAIRGAEAQRLADKPPRDYTWTDAVWRGIDHQSRGTREDNEKARQLFERAIEIDPRLPRPYAYVGYTYVIELLNGWSTDATLLDKAEEFGQRAVELDVWRPEAAGHLTLAMVNIARGRPDRAILETERTLEIVPNDAAALTSHALALAMQGRFVEAARSVKRASRVDARHGQTVAVVTAYVNYGTGRRAEAIDLLERVRLARRDNVTVRVVLAAYYEQAGRHTAAADVVDEILRVAPDLTAERATRLLPGWETIIGAEEFARFPGYLRAAGLP